MNEHSTPHGKQRALPRPFSFHWGGGQIVEEAAISNEWHQPTIQLLQYDDGSLSIRFCSYSHHGQFQRSPLMVNAGDLPALREALAACPRLSALIQQLTAG